MGQDAHHELPLRLVHPDGMNDVRGGLRAHPWNPPRAGEMHRRRSSRDARRGLAPLDGKRQDGYDRAGHAGPYG